MSMEIESPPPGGAMVRLRRLALALMILALAGAIGWLLAERNSRFYFLSTEGGSLQVARGVHLPFGKRPWAPADPGLAEAYAGIELPAGAAAIPERRFDERQDLDRALFEILADWADARIRTDEPARMREGLGYVERAAKLPGISSDQRRRLRALRAELAYFEGRDRLERGGQLLQEALEQLQLATEASPGRAREAVAIVDELQPAVERLTRALQTARGLRGPAAGAAAPAPAAAGVAEGEARTGTGTGIGAGAATKPGEAAQPAAARPAVPAAGEKAVKPSPALPAAAAEDFEAER